MAAPVYETAAAGATDAQGNWSYNGANSSPGRVIILHVLQDGATSGAVALTGITAGMREALDGTANTMTYIGEFPVGGSSQALQHLWIGRQGTVTGAYSGTNSTSEDLYFREYHFSSVSTGTTLATVIENATAGSTTNSTGTSATAEDASVTTLGADRLALNFLAINDDNPFAGFTGESGGTWATRASYAEASGTDGAIYLIDAAMAAAGTINGGTGSITDSDAWGVVGFALIGTTAAPPANPPDNTILKTYPQLLAH